MGTPKIDIQSGTRHPLRRDTAAREAAVPNPLVCRWRATIGTVVEAATEEECDDSNLHAEARGYEHVWVPAGVEGAAAQARHELSGATPSPN